MQKSLIYILFITCFIASISAQTFAQNRVSGLVKDQNEAIIVGARVFLLNLQTRMEKVAVTNSGGIFTFEKVTPGNYEIRVAAEGFAQQVVPVLITNAEADNLEITLAIGASNLTVTAEIGHSEQLRNVPQAVSVVTSEEMLERSSSVLSQLGREEAGLNVQTTSPTIGAVVVRGLTGKNVVNFVDGVRYTNSAQRGGINTFFNLNEPSSLQVVEVLRGPNSAQYGSDSLGGTVNLITKTPIFGTDKNEFHGEINPFYYSASRAFGSNILLRQDLSV